MEELVLEATEKIVGWSNILPNQFDFSAVFFNGDNQPSRL